MTYTEIVKKLIGNVQPAGDSSIDVQRIANLKEMCELVNELVREIDSVHYNNEKAYQSSIKEMAKFADDFLTNTLGISK